MNSKSENVTLDARYQWCARPREQMSVLAIEDFDMLEAYVQAWEELAGEALEPNPFYEPWMLMPALRSFAAGKDVRVVLVFAADHGESILCGVFPIEKRLHYKKLPVASFSLWQHLYCALCMPLVRAGYGPQCLDAFFEWLRSQRDCAVMEFNLVSGEGPVHQLLNGRLTEHQEARSVCESYHRAMFQPMDSADQYLRAALSREHRKDLRRRTRRLAELGHLEFNSLEPAGDIDTWTKEFLELEASGWKSNDGGAFACSDVNREYFVTVAKAAFERGKLMMLALRLDGKPLAMKCNIISAPGSFAFKIAFDENYSAYSPGVMLELENIRRLHADPHIEWMDSCAAPDHPMIDRLWPGRRSIRSLVVPAGNKTGELVIAALPFIKSLNRKIRGIAHRG